MTFDEARKQCPLPGEFDAMDTCDQDRWTGVMQFFFDAGQRSVLEGEPVAWLDEEGKVVCLESVLGGGTINSKSAIPSKWKPLATFKKGMP